MTGLDRYPLASRRLHWAIAAVVLAAIPLGFAAHDAGGGVLLAHLAFGGGAVLLSLLRLSRVRRLPTSAEGPAWKRRVASVVHWALRLIPLALGLSGAAMVASVGLPALVQGGADLSDAPPAAVHGVLGRVLIACLTLHLLAATLQGVTRRETTTA